MPRISTSRTSRKGTHRKVIWAKEMYGLAKIKAPAGDIRVDAVRSKFGLTQAELGRITGYSTRAIAGWEGGKSLSQPARQRFTETERLRIALAEIIPDDRIGDWLKTPNAAFENQTPLQILERGEMDRLWQMIFQITANVAS